MVPTRFFLRELHEPSISKVLAKATKAAESPEVMEIHLDWCTPFMIYLRTGGLLGDKVERERLCRRVGQHTLVNDELFG
jgi:hypothetical protein